jgi:hypothetical protein
MGKWIAVACLVLAACKPMYGDPAPRVKNPTRHNPPPDWKQDPVVEVTYIDECEVNFRLPPTAKRDTKVAQQKMVAGDGAAANIKPDLDAQKRASLAVQSVYDYSQALVADPYNPEVTLKLALAYDKVLRRGCALAMLKRLDALAANPKFGAEAVKHQLADNAQWFKRYRKDAIEAAGAVGY